MSTPDRTEHDTVVRSTISNGVATVILDSPANRNALSSRLCAQLLDEMTAAVEDDDVRVIVLTHTGPVFCAGADLKEDPERKEATARDFAATLELLWTCPKPVIARLAGPARAGGTGLVAAADFAVAVDTVTFAFTEVRIGVVPAVISVPLRHRVVPHALHRLFLTGDTFDAHHAVTIGLLTAVASVDGLDDEIRRLIDSLVLSAPQAWAGTKQLVRAECPSIATELESMRRLSTEYFRSDEAQEGLRAFAERRRPAWAPST